MIAPADIALCIPAYNAASFLPRLLESASAQTVPFSEIWVYDDASSDPTARIAREFCARVIRGETNQGCSHGKNRLARECSSKWIHFHDADDLLKPDFVEHCLPWMAAPERADVVFFAYESRFFGTEKPAGAREFSTVDLERDPLGYTLTEQINPFCGLYRREAFLAAGGWDEDRSVLQCEDQAGHVRLALAGLKFSADPAVTVINYIRAGSMTTANLAGANRAIYELLAKTLATGRIDAYRAPVGTRLWKVAGFAASWLDWETARRASHLARSLRAPLPPETGRLFRCLAPVDPMVALWVRERMIRLFRPGARRAA